MEVNNQVRTSIKDLLKTLSRLNKNRGKMQFFRKTDSYIGNLDIEFAVQWLKKLEKEGTSTKSQLVFPTSISDITNLSQSNPTDKLEDELHKYVAEATAMKRKIEELDNKVNLLKDGYNALKTTLEKLETQKYSSANRTVVSQVTSNSKNNSQGELDTILAHVNKDSLHERASYQVNKTANEVNLITDYEKGNLNKDGKQVLLGLSSEEASNRSKNHNPTRQDVFEKVALLQKVGQGEESYVSVPSDLNQFQYFIFPVQGKIFSKETIWTRAYGYFFDLVNEDRVIPAHRNYKVLHPAVVELQTDGYYHLVKKGVIEVLQ